MSEDTTPWSGLGNNMLLPSTLKNEIEQLRLMIRDLSLETRQSTIAIKSNLEARILRLEESLEDLRQVVSDVHKQGIYLEGRIHDIKGNVDMAAEKIDEFSVYSFFDPKDAGIVIEEEEMIPLEEIDGVELTHVKEGFVAPLPDQPEIVDVQPDGSANAPVLSEESEEESSYWWDGMDEGAIADELVGLIGDHISGNGPIMNNQVAKKVYPSELELTSGIKKNIKEILNSDDCPFDSYTVDKFRRLYYIADHEDDNPEGGAEVYERYTSGTTTA